MKQKVLPYWAAITMAIFAVVIIGIWGVRFLGEWVQPETKFTLVGLSEIVRNYGLVVGGLLAAALTFWRIHVADQQRAIAEQGQVTERFTRAVEQLGNTESIAIRLGGIYALERIARDSARDHWMIMELLCAFIREASPVIPEIDAGTGEPLEQPNATQDVQAAVTVIARRTVAQDPPGARLNLESANLRGLVLEGKPEQRLNLAMAQLSHSDLSGAKLKWVTLANSDLSFGCLASTRLTHVDLSGSDLGGIKFYYAIVEDCLFREASTFPSADFISTKFYAISGSEQGPRLSRILRDSETLCDFTGASMTFTRIQGAMLTGTNLKPEQLKKVRFDAKTKFPIDVTPPQKETTDKSHEKQND